MVPGMLALGALQSSPHTLALAAETPVPSLLEKGERHAGNNFFQAVLRYNFPGVIEHTSCDTSTAASQEYFCCWTHGYANDDCADVFDPPLTAMALVVRNPYSWLLAMYKKPYEHLSLGQRNFSQFLRDSFTYWPTKYSGARSDKQASAPALWVAKVDSYTSLSKLPSVVLTHLDLFDADALTRKLAPLTENGGYFLEGAEQRVQTAPLLATGNASNQKMAGEFTKEAFDEAYEYEVSKGWLASYTDADLAFVNSIIGEERMRDFGFETVVSVAESSSRSSSTLDASAAEDAALAAENLARRAQVLLVSDDPPPGSAVRHRAARFTAQRERYLLGLLDEEGWALPAVDKDVRAE